MCRRRLTGQRRLTVTDSVTTSKSLSLSALSVAPPPPRQRRTRARASTKDSPSPSFRIKFNTWNINNSIREERRGLYLEHKQSSHSASSFSL
jgi:hypothetical protein